MIYFLINSKNFPEVEGPNIVRLARTIDQFSKESRERGINIRTSLACPAFSLALIRKQFPRLKLYSQHLDNLSPGSNTGYLIPELAKSYGADGSIVNHSEHRLPLSDIGDLVKSMRSLGLESIVCARTPDEAAVYAKFLPDFIAIEPPELIGSGNAVSKSKPEVIVKSREAIRKLGKKAPILLCGAGIVEPIDARRAVELGSRGILIASGVVKSKSWRNSIRELAQAMVDVE